MYESGKTGIILIDPYNDFISEGGKIWPMVKDVAEAVGFLPNLKKIIKQARANDIQIFFVPHHRWEHGDYETWRNPTPYQLKTAQYQTFEKGTWGGEFHPDFQPQKGDVVIKEHWSASGFANTDLDQQLRQHGIEKIIIVGLLANSCAESTARYGSELGYHVTLVKDATAAYSNEAMHAAHEINGPMFAHRITTTNDLLGMLGETEFEEEEQLHGEQDKYGHLSH